MSTHRNWAILVLALLVGAAVVGCGSAKPASVAATVAATAPRPAAAGPVEVVSMGAAGFMLADSARLSLYFYAQDVMGSGQSACDAACAAARPPVTTSTPTFAQPAVLPPGSLATISRSDGTLQITYAGRPLYRSPADQVRGDAKGQSDSWLVARVELICDCFQEH